ncbi:MAG TPA: hypothetical protein VJ790_12095 [Dongiaceae bacterium]|nr:hypothetical protein [Dongiaceae bacterium]
MNAIIEKFGTSRKAISCGSLLGLAPNMGGETTFLGAGLPEEPTARSEKSVPSIEHITALVARRFSVAGTIKNASLKWPWVPDDLRKLAEIRPFPSPKAAFQ